MIGRQGPSPKGCAKKVGLGSSRGGVATEVVPISQSGAESGAEARRGLQRREIAILLREILVSLRRHSSSNGPLTRTSPKRAAPARPTQRQLRASCRGTSTKFLPSRTVISSPLAVSIVAPAASILETVPFTVPTSISSPSRRIKTRFSVWTETQSSRRLPLSVMPVTWAMVAGSKDGWPTFTGASLISMGMVSSAVSLRHAAVGNLDRHFVVAVLRRSPTKEPVAGIDSGA